MRITPLEKGLWAWGKSVEALGTNGGSDVELTEAARNVHHAIELLFKHLLYIKNDPRLFADRAMHTRLSARFGRDIPFEEISKANTISFWNLLPVMTSVYSDFPTTLVSDLRQLNQIRNPSQHFGVVAERDAFRQLADRIIKDVERFLSAHILNFQQSVRVILQETPKELITWFENEYKTYVWPELHDVMEKGKSQKAFEYIPGLDPCDAISKAQDAICTGRAWCASCRQPILISDTWVVVTLPISDDGLTRYAALKHEACPI